MKRALRIGAVGVALALLILAALVVIAPTQVKKLISNVLVRNGYISVELPDAPAGHTPQDRVAAWLRRYRHEIDNLGHTYRIAPVAIAGAIAYESLANAEPSYYLGLAEYTGPGKVHYREYRFSEGEPIAREVEDEGYLPREHESERQYILSTPTGAITYIAVIMDAFANVSTGAGYKIRCNPAALITLYSAWNLRDIKRHFASTARHTLELNDAGQWYADNSAWIMKSQLGSPCTYATTGYFRPSKPPILHLPRAESH